MADLETNDVILIIVLTIVLVLIITTLVLLKLNNVTIRSFLNRKIRNVPQPAAVAAYERANTFRERSKSSSISRSSRECSEGLDYDKIELIIKEYQTLSLKDESFRHNQTEKTIIVKNSTADENI